MYRLYILLIVTFFIGCEDTPVTTINQTPICQIITPTHGEIIIRNDTVVIRVEAIDNDGGISEVRFNIDGTDMNSDRNPPFEYIWKTEGESFGLHTIDVTCYDDKAAKSVDELTVDIIFGNELVETFTDNRDGQVYKIIKIGKQTWFAENLNFDILNSLYYDNDSSNGKTYGRLYYWEDVLDICPPGWHLPSDVEWKQLELVLGMSQQEVDMEGWRGTYEGEMLKSSTGWQSGGNGNNLSNFLALPGGSAVGMWTFSGLGYSGGWWTSSIEGYKYWHRLLSGSENGIRRTQLNGIYGCSVRCVKDSN